jgi:hypothetical protein
VSAYGLGGATGSYRFVLNQTSITDLSLAAPYSGTVVGAGEAQLFRLSLPEGQGPLAIA